MNANVVQKVVEDLAKPPIVAGHDGRTRDLERDRAVGLDGPSAFHSFRRDPPHVHRFALEGTSLVQPRQQQQVVDQDPHP